MEPSSSPSLRKLLKKLWFSKRIGKLNNTPHYFSKPVKTKHKKKQRKLLSLPLISTPPSIEATATLSMSPASLSAAPPTSTASSFQQPFSATSSSPLPRALTSHPPPSPYPPQSPAIPAINANAPVRNTAKAIQSLHSSSPLAQNPPDRPFHPPPQDIASAYSIQATGVDSAEGYFSFPRATIGIGAKRLKVVNPDIRTPSPSISNSSGSQPVKPLAAPLAQPTSEPQHNSVKAGDDNRDDGKLEPWPLLDIEPESLHQPQTKLETAREHPYHTANPEDSNSHQGQMDDLEAPSHYMEMRRSSPIPGALRRGTRNPSPLRFRRSWELLLRAAADAVRARRIGERGSELFLRGSAKGLAFEPKEDDGELWEDEDGGEQDESKEGEEIPIVYAYVAELPGDMPLPHSAGHGVRSQHARRERCVPARPKLIEGSEAVAQGPQAMFNYLNGALEDLPSVSMGDEWLDFAREFDW